MEEGTTAHFSNEAFFRSSAAPTLRWFWSLLSRKSSLYLLTRLVKANKLVDVRIFYLFVVNAVCKRTWSCYLYICIFELFIAGLSAQCLRRGFRIPQLQEGDEMRLECRTCDNKLVFFRWWQRWGHHTRAWKWQALWPAARDTWESVEYGGVMQRWLNMTMVSIKMGCFF